MVLRNGCTELMLGKIMGELTKKRVKVLFLVWGESIHARRRISLFTEDTAFEVAVVSTFNYAFSNAQNVLLTEARPKHQPVSSNFLPWRVITTISSYLKAFLAAWKIFRSSGVLSEAGGTLRHLSLIKTVFFTPETRYDVKLAVNDFHLLRQTVEDFQPDVIFLQTLLYPCYLSNFLPREIPVIITFWNGDVTWWAQWRGLERLLKKQMVTYGVQRARAMTVCSRVAYEACLNYGVPADKVHMIRYPGVDLERFRPAPRDTACKSLGIESGRVILCPRGLGDYLNSDVIIEAAAVAIAKAPDLLFLFISGAGGDIEWQKHLQRARELGIADHLRRDGQIPWERMPLYYQAADAVVSISSNDSLPYCMLEAMACGIPLVMGDIPQIREWITDGVNGLLAPPRDPDEVAGAMLQLLESDEVQTTAFVKHNLELVDRIFDSRKNSFLIKKLVSDIAANKIERD